MAEHDLVVYPAKLVRTMDPSRPTAEAVAVRGDRIRAVGSMEELAAYGSARIDERYAESVLFPGFVEAHTHVFGGALWKYTYVGFHERQSPDGRRWLGCPDLDAVRDRLREADASIEDPAEPLMAWGLDPIFFAGERLDRRLLDEVSSTRPIFVMHQSFHLATVNSVVLGLDGITRDTVVVGVAKGGDGEPTGELQERVAMGLVKSAPFFGGLVIDDEAVRNFGADARNHGVTTLVDLGNRALMEPGTVEVLNKVVNDETFPGRLSVFYMAGGSDDTTTVIARLRQLRLDNTPKLRIDHVKFVLDGSIQGFTARLHAPGYLPDDRKGIWVIAPEAFQEAFLAFHDAGFTVHVHCNGDEATELFLDTVEKALARHPRSDHRHTVTHSQLSTRAQYRRMAALGMCANIFANHIWYWGDAHRDLILGPDRASRMNAAATAVDLNVPISLHCDTPVTPLDALATVSIAATRTTSSGALLGEQERISVPDALHAMTLGSAYMLKMDHEVGSIESGKYADFAVLDRDPYVCEPQTVRDVVVQGTMVGGRAFDGAGL